VLRATIRATSGYPGQTPVQTHGTSEIPTLDQLLGLYLLLRCLPAPDFHSSCCAPAHVNSWENRDWGLGAGEWGGACHWPYFRLLWWASAHVDSSGNGTQMDTDYFHLSLPLRWTQGQRRLWRRPAQGQLLAEPGMDTPKWRWLWPEGPFLSPTTITPGPVCWFHPRGSRSLACIKPVVFLPKHIAEVT
jgi:hypothetical protein